MLRIRPFHALRPSGNRAALVSCPPVGVLCGCCDDETGDSYRRVLAAGDAPQVRSLLSQLVECGALCADPEPRLFVYRISRAGRRQVGLVAHVDRRDVDGADRDAPAWCEPTSAVFDDPQAAIADLAVCDMNERPIFHFNAGDGTTHSGWTVRDASRYCAAFERIDGRAELLGPAASVGDGFVFAALFERSCLLDPPPILRCGLFVPRAVLVP